MAEKPSDVKRSSTTTAFGSGTATQLVPVGQRARLRSFTLDSTTATYSFLNGSTGDGTLMFNVPIKASDQNPFHVNLPGRGLMFDNGIAVRLVSADAAIYASGIHITYEG